MSPPLPMDSVASALVALADNASEEMREHLFRKAYKPGQHLFIAGDPANHLFLVLTGRIRIYMLDPEGHEVTFWHCHPGDFFGIAEIFGSVHSRRGCAACCEVSEVLHIHHFGLPQILAQSPDMAFKIMAQLSDRLRLVEGSLLDVVTSPAGRRLAQLLLRLAKDVSPECDGRYILEERYTQQEMANMIGTSRQTTSRLLADFRRRGLISIQSGRVVLERLRDMYQSV